MTTYDLLLEETDQPSLSIEEAGGLPLHERLARLGLNPIKDGEQA